MTGLNLWGAMLTVGLVCTLYTTLVSTCYLPTPGITLIKLPTIEQKVNSILIKDICDIIKGNESDVANIDFEL